MREVEQRPEQHPEHHRRDRKLGPRPLLVWNSWARFGTTLQDACFGGKQGSVLEAEWLNLHQLGESLAQPDETCEANGRRIRARRETLVVVGPRLAPGVTLAFASNVPGAAGALERITESWQGSTVLDKAPKYLIL